MVRNIRNIALIFTLLLLGGMATETWAYKVTYYILTLPLNHETGTKNTKSEHDGKRIAAIKAFDDIGTVVGLDEHLAHFKSPLAKNFSYFDASIVKYDGAKQMYVTHTTKYPLYGLSIGNGPISPYIQVTVSNHAVSGTIIGMTKSDWDAVADASLKKEATTKTAFDTTISGLADGTYYFKICLDEESAITANCDIFVTYEYNPDNGIAKLDGSESYNIEINGGFVAYNKGRNNRMAVIPAKYSNGKERITGEQLSSKQFVQVDVTGTSVSPWWNGNLTPKDRIYSYYHFLFKYEGEDPYNITIRSAYEDEDKVNPDYYIELYGSSDTYSVNKLYEGSSIFAYRKSTDQSDELLLASDDNVKYTTANDKTDHTHTIGYTDMPGFYRNLGGAIWNSFAMLNNSTNTGYVFMGTKCVKSDGTFEIPSDSKKESGYYKYYYFNINDQNKLYYTLQTAITASNKSSTDQEMYETHTYTFKVKTPNNTVISVDKEWSEAYASYNIMEHIPDGIKRKYVSFDGAYKTDAYDGIDNNELTTFADANTNATVEDGKKVIWLKYSSSMPFEALPLDGNYQNARWYTMRMNGDVYDKYLAYDNGSSELVTTNGSGATKGSDSNVHQGEADGTVTQVAFMGDPFKLRILGRKASETERDNRYIGCTTDATDNTALNTNNTTSDISTWEIVDDGGYMVLRKFGSYANPMYIGMGSAANNKPVTYSSTASRIKVVELSQKEYVYHIYNMANNIAVKASITQDIGKQLILASIPEVIRSPFLALPGVTFKFYYSAEDALYNEGAGRNEQTYAPFDAPTHKDIYVRYFGMTEALANPLYNRVKFDNTQEFNVNLNGQYLYYNSSGSESVGYINSKYPISDDESNTYDYVWKLLGGDPYAMQVTNTAEALSTSNYVHASKTNNSFITFGTSDGAARFVAKSSNTTNTFEVMLATGDDVDATTEYYNIGRNEESRVKIFNNTTYPHTNSQLRFLLTLKGSTAKYYHLIDKAGHELVTVRTRDERLAFPADYWSPLVSNYHYYLETDFDIDNGPDGVAKTADDIYTLKGSATEITSVGANTDIYVIYDTNNLVNLKKGVLYRLKFDIGDSFRQEDGHDDLTKAPVRAVYPYCNGDCNFFVYGQDEYELQQQGAASTRTRWVWYLESDNNDPYHVKICSRQQEEYPANSGNKYIAYFRTCAVKYNQDAESAPPHIITTLTWPGITPDQGTEYMVLGSEGMYQLVTTETIPIDLNNDGNYNGENESNDRHVVKSFEQYWKTYDTVKNKLLKDILEDKDKGANPTGSTLVPEDPSSYRTLLTGTGTGQYGFHSYPHWAYAKRFNGYNNESKTKKGWEEIEHWYQTVNMGEGYFDFVKTTVDPALILLDQHGWEIMRKPLPSSPEDPEKEDKYKALKAYDSPMVKEYYFWTSTKKMTGYHQYYNLSDQITVDGKPYASTSLTKLAPYATAKNVKDAKGNLNDQYVTYVVKDEYAKSYNPATDKESGVGTKFLIQQGNNYVSTADGSTLTTNTATGGMAAVIVAANGSFSDDYLWYVKPNPNIDNEMGYGVSGNASSEHKEWKADYTDDTKLTGYPSNGFDPYNIQISSAAYPAKFFVTDATEALLDDGIVTANGTTISLGTGADPTYSATKYYDGSKLAISNKTFMAVADADGSIQLMPRFDQNKRIRNFNTLETPVGEASKLNEMKTSLYLPTVYEYHIIDNSGNESLRYKSGGDLNPQTPDHFKSPLAKDFKYYSSQTDSDSDGEYDDEITASFASATLTDGNVYVRYQYDEPADAFRMLEGKWLTMQLNAKDAIYNAGIKQADGDKPATINATNKIWQWKFLKTPQTDPDPYNVQLFNRDNKDNELPADTHYALLSHTSGGYALAKAGRNDYTYQFLNGRGMDDSHNAAIEEDRDYSDPESQSGFTSTSGVFHGTDSQVKLLDDVEHTFTYKIYTNSNVLAIDGEQDNQTVQDNDFKPVVPDNIKSPLLKLDYFRYYNKDNLTFSGDNIATADTTGKALNNLYGLYDDIVCVRYLPYNPDDSPYKVPNVMGQEGGHITRGAGSNDAGLGLDGKLLYNIAWYNDQMMKNNSTSIESTDCDDLSPAWTPTATTEYEWHFDGSDPYAIKIKSVGASDNVTSKYVHQVGETTTCNLDASATTFMILNKEDYDYGVLAVTGDKTKMLSYGVYDHDNDAGTADIIGAHITTSDPTKFIFYALATHKVIYHLVIAPTATNTENPEEGCYETIPYWNGSEVVAKKIPGSTQRDLTSKKDDDPSKPVGSKYQLGETMSLGGKDVIYCYDAGHISLGDKLSVPSEFYRPNVGYTFVVEGVYSDDACTFPVDAMNTEYKGHEVTNMGDDSGLLNTVVRVNIVYTFDGTLDTNSGLDFVRSISDNKWYSFETSGSTPWMAQFTNAWGLEVKEGRGTHYTNDYLWSPLGDPYGFRMYNRYIYKNSWNTTEENNCGEQNRVMTTTAFAEEQPVSMTANNSTDPKNDPYNVYELLSGSADGYFYVHPVTNNTGTKYYLRTKKYDEEGKKGTFIILSETPTNFTFGLSDELVKPYFDLMGYVGGLTKAAYDANPTIATAIKNGTPLTALQLMDAQTLVYNDANLVSFTSGYYRMHSPEGLAGIDGIRYASGYTHKREESDAVPMHFYEVEGTASQFNLLKSKDGERVNEGFTSSVATRGDIPIPAVESDPASIFYITGTYDNAKIQTQGLYVKGEIGMTRDNGTPAETIEAEGVRAKAQMTSTVGSASELWIMDIGGGVMLIHDRSIPRYRKYLSYDQTEDSRIYDLKLTHNTHTDHAKWCLQPANNLGLKIATHSGGDEGTYGTAYNYSTFYAPFDILLPDDENDENDNTKITKQYRAFICDTKISPWNDADLHPRPISWYNIEENNCPSDYRGSMKFVPAGTPVILAAIDDSESGYIKVTIPTSAPSTTASLVENFKVKLNATDLDDETRNNTLTGQYLEQKLAVGDKGYVYVFGLPYSGTFDEASYNTNGEIGATLPSPTNSGWGFYKNINPNKEAGPSNASWTRNNWYILGNKVYYRAAGAPVGAPAMSPEFVPVIFDDLEEPDEELNPDGSREIVGDGCVYDLMGRKVATREQVEDGSWKQRVASGIYIINGKKIRR